jgi:flagellin-like protein
MRIYKKSVSPLIATILIIVVALALAAILLSWGQNFVQTNTSKVDDSIDMSCNGADIKFSYCDYNSVSEELSFIIVNSGEVNFTEENKFNAILIDDDQNLVNRSDFLNSQAFNKGESSKIVFENYQATSPIKIELRSSLCPNFMRIKTCK